MNTIKLEDGQLQSLKRLIDDEKQLNLDNNDGAYNPYWDNILTAMGFEA